MNARRCPVARPVITRLSLSLGWSNRVGLSISATTFAHAERAR